MLNVNDALAALCGSLHAWTTVARILFKELFPYVTVYVCSYATRFFLVDRNSEDTGTQLGGSWSHTLRIRSLNSAFNPRSRFNFKFLAIGFETYQTNSKSAYN